MVFEKGNKLETVWEEVFRYCKNLAEIRLPEGLKSIGDDAFLGCESLKGIQLPDGLEKIGAWCFYESGLEEIVLPASTKEVGKSAF